MIGYVKCFDDNETVSFLADDTYFGLGESRKEFLKEYTKVWEKIKDLIGKKFDAEPVYSEKYIKTKIKSHNNDIRTNFHDEGNSRKVPKGNCSYKCLALMSLDSVIQLGKKCFPQTLLEECKYKLTNKKVEDLIADDFDSRRESDSESESESDSESGNE